MWNWENKSYCGSSKGIYTRPDNHTSHNIHGCMLWCYNTTRFYDRDPSKTMGTENWKKHPQHQSCALQPPKTDAFIPRNLADKVSYAPENILKLVKCVCSSDQPCSGGNCGCMVRQLVCTVFCVVKIRATAIPST